MWEKGRGKERKGRREGEKRERARIEKGNREERG
jgi:hypothetical protein